MFSWSDPGNTRPSKAESLIQSSFWLILITCIPASEWVTINDAAQYFLTLGIPVSDHLDLNHT